MQLCKCVRSPGQFNFLVTSSGFQIIEFFKFQWAQYLDNLENFNLQRDDERKIIKHNDKKLSHIPLINLLSLRKIHETPTKLIKANEVKEGNNTMDFGGCLPTENYEYLMVIKPAILFV